MFGMDRAVLTSVVMLGGTLFSYPNLVPQFRIFLNGKTLISRVTDFR